MILLVFGGLAIANIPGIAIMTLFMIYGTLRSSTLLPTIITLVRTKVSEPGMFYGVIVSLVVGLPAFGYGIFNKIIWLSISASLFTVLASGTIVLIAGIHRRAAWR